MDNKTESVLVFINAFCKQKYRVLSFDNIIQGITLCKLSHKDLRNALEYLKYKNYVSIKYFSDIEVCISAMPNAQIYLDNKPYQTQNSNVVTSTIITDINYKMLAVIVFLCSLISTTIVLVVFRLVGDKLW